MLTLWVLQIEVLICLINKWVKCYWTKHSEGSPRVSVLVLVFSLRSIREKGSKRYSSLAKFLKIDF